MENILSLSILSIDFGNMEKSLQRVEKAGVKCIHVDVMDGNFVPNISFGPSVIEYVRKAVPEALIDAHLMIDEPIRFLEDYKKAGCDIVTVHYEAVKHLDATVDAIKKLGMKAGVALNPATDISALNTILPKLDMVLIMSVNPGFGGQKLIPYTVDKVRRLRKLLNEEGLGTDIEIDGGVNLSNIDDILEAGANVIVAGTAVFNGDIEKNVSEFNMKLKKA